VAALTRRILARLVHFPNPLTKVCCRGPKGQKRHRIHVEKGREASCLFSPLLNGTKKKLATKLERKQEVEMCEAKKAKTIHHRVSSSVFFVCDARAGARVMSAERFAIQATVVDSIYLSRI
jgi:hypothetical protein